MHEKVFWSCIDVQKHEPLHLHEQQSIVISNQADCKLEHKALLMNAMRIVQVGGS